MKRMVANRELLSPGCRTPWPGAARSRARAVATAAGVALCTAVTGSPLAAPLTAAPPAATPEAWGVWPVLLALLLVLLVLLAVICLGLLARQRQLIQALAEARATPPPTPLPVLEAPHDAPAPEPDEDLEARAEAEANHEHESFSYTVSHDLRAPIRVVEGFTKILKEDYGRVLDRIGNDHLDRVLGAAARMNAMIDALLALSQLSSQPLARQPVNLSQLAAYVAEDLRRQWPDREVQLQIEAEMEVQGDPTLLRVVVENLLGNAWKYTGKCAKAEIAFVRHPRDRHTFTVRDNGAGFDMRFADRLFGVFQRLHSASDYQGTGIGLASVRRILRRHGGEIWAESEVNRGAQFHFSVGR